MKAFERLLDWVPFRKKIAENTGVAEVSASVSKEGALTKIKTSLVNYFVPFKGVSSLSALLGIFFTIFVLTKFLSPIIGKLALEPIVVPLAASGLLIVGQFETAKLQQMFIENAGVVASTLGIVMALLFVQNCMKSTLLIQSVRHSHRSYMMHAIAGLLTPITTSALWAYAVDLGYYPLSMKSVGIAILAIFAGPTLASLPIDSIASIGEIAKQARLPMLLILLLHLVLIVLTYRWIYRGIEGVLARIWHREWTIPKLPDGLLKNNMKIVLEEYQKTPFPADLVVFVAIAVIVSYFKIISWPIACMVIAPILLVLSEYKRFWCEDDTKGRRFEFLEYVVVKFTEDEAKHRKMTRQIMIGFSSFFASLGFLLYDFQHTILAGICAGSLIIGNLAIMIRNKKIFLSAEKDGRTLDYHRLTEQRKSK